MLGMVLRDVSASPGEVETVERGVFLSSGLENTVENGLNDT